MKMGAIETPIWSVRFDLRMAPSALGTRPAPYRAALDMAEASDRAGCSSIIISEHHGAEDGYLPSTTCFAAAVAARTGRARLALSALILPLLEPIHTAEETLVIDQLSDGRVDVIVGMGYVRNEYAMFGLDPRSRVQLLEEKLPIYLAALTGEPLKIDGRTVRVTPPPVQRPRPTVLLAASVAAAARRAARLADGVHCLVARSEIGPAYLGERRNLGLDDGRVEGGLGSPGSLFVAEDPERAWAELAPFMLHEANSYARWAVENGANQHLYSPVKTVAELQGMGMYRVVTTAEAIDELDSSPGVILNPLVGGLPVATAERYLNAFIDDVLPSAVAKKS
jgi:alkanesulfonate monooxygenase SsuD/methylene tetrahydromethanopterin reductase-like flavin-dependent oxidoreductase (luciferase family)